MGVLFVCLYKTGSTDNHELRLDGKVQGDHMVLQQVRFELPNLDGTWTKRSDEDISKVGHRTRHAFAVKLDFDEGDFMDD